MGGVQHGVPCKWQLPWLAIEEPWSALAWAFLSFLTQTGVDKAPLPFKGLHFWHCSQFSAFTGRRALTIVSSLMSGCGRGHGP